MGLARPTHACFSALRFLINFFFNGIIGAISGPPLVSMNARGGHVRLNVQISVVKHPLPSRDQRGNVSRSCDYVVTFRHLHTTKLFHKPWPQK